MGQKDLATAVTGETEFFHDFGFFSLGDDSAVKVGTLAIGIALKFLETLLVMEPFVGEHFTTVHTAYGNNHLIEGRGLRQDPGQILPSTNSQMSSTLFSRGVTSQIGSKARADRIDSDIYNLKLAAGEILGLKRSIETQAAQIATLEAALKDQQDRNIELVAALKSLEERLTKRLETTEGDVGGLQKGIQSSN